MMDRGVKITLGDEEYYLLLTTGATKEICKRYGGLENLGDKLMAGEKLDDALDEVAWLLITLANQGIAYENKKCGTNKAPLTAADIDLYTSPAELVGYRPTITEAINKGMTRNIISEENGKNAEGE